MQYKQPKVLGKVREVQGKSKYGEVFPVEISLTEYEISSRHVFTALMRDLTERQRAERERVILREQLQTAQKMQTVGQLTGGIAHDFNNILASIMGYTGLAKTRKASQQDLKLISYLEEVYSAAERARDLIAQLLAFSRGTVGTRKALQLPLVVKEIERMIQVTLPSTVDCTLEVQKNLPFVEIDPVHFHQLVLNLCINPRDALHGSGHINIRLRQTSDVHGECASC